MGMFGIPSFSTTSRQPQAGGSSQDVRLYLYRLGKSLESSNLSGAKKMYDVLTQWPPFNRQDDSSHLSTAFSTLGMALQSGNIANAQQAFSSLQYWVNTTPPANLAASRNTPLPHLKNLLATLPDNDSKDAGTALRHHSLDVYV